MTETALTSVYARMIVARIAAATEPYLSHCLAEVDRHVEGLRSRGLNADADALQRAAYDAAMPDDDFEDFPGDEELGYHGADEVPPGHPDALDYQGFDEYGGQPCPHGPHWRHCSACNPEGER